VLQLLPTLAEANSIGDLLPVFSAVSSIGFAMWYGSYTAVYLLPGMEKAHTEQLDKIQAQHSVTVDKLVTEMKEQREAFDRWKTSQR